MELPSNKPSRESPTPGYTPTVWIAVTDTAISVWTIGMVLKRGRLDRDCLLMIDHSIMIDRSTGLEHDPSTLVDLADYHPLDARDAGDLLGQQPNIAGPVDYPPDVDHPTRQLDLQAVKADIAQAERIDLVGERIADDGMPRGELSDGYLWQR